MLKRERESCEFNLTLEDFVCYVVKQSNNIYKSMYTYLVAILTYLKNKFEKRCFLLCIKKKRTKKKL